MNFMDYEKILQLNFNNTFLKEFNDFVYNIDNNSVQNSNFTKILKTFNVFFDKMYFSYSENNGIKIDIIDEATNYAMVGMGKRIRPFIIFLSYYIFNGKDYINIFPFMLAIEMIHTFSLIHDDLPAIDNDLLRRGKKSVWAKYGEDNAILIGDLLIHNAYQIISDYIKNFNLNNKVILSLLLEEFNSIIDLSGRNGMIKGEMLDVINTNNKNLSIDELLYIYEYKTSKLIYLSFEIGARLSNNDVNKDFLYRFSNLIGLSYQIKDDLLEITSNENVLGKSINSDLKNNKSTVANILGIEKTKELLDKYNDDIKKLIKNFKLCDVKYEKLLLMFVEYLLRREY